MAKNINNNEINVTNTHGGRDYKRIRQSDGSQDRKGLFGNVGDWILAKMGIKKPEEQTEQE